MYQSGVNGADYTPNKYQNLANMVGKIAQTVLRNVQSEDVLGVFDKLPVNNGDTIEQVVISLIQGQDYDRTGKNTLAPKEITNLAVRYFQNWEPRVFKQTIYLSDIRKVMTGEYSAESVADKLISALFESDKHEKYVKVRDMLYWGAKNGSLSESNSVLVNKGAVAKLANDSPDYKGILKKLKNIIHSFMFVGTTNNAGGILQKSKKEDIYVIMPYQVSDSIDVDDLAGVFNLDKTRIDAKIILTDMPNNETSKIFVVDQNAILDYTRLYELMPPQINAEGRFYNYFLHTERLYGISPLFNGVFFEVEGIGG